MHATCSAWYGFSCRTDIGFHVTWQTACSCKASPWTQIYSHELIIAFNTPDLHFCLSSEHKCTSRLNKQTHDFNHTHSLISCNIQHSQLSNTCSEPKQLYKMRVAFCKPVLCSQGTNWPTWSQTMTFIQPGLAAAMCTTPCGWHHLPTSLCPTCSALYVV